MIVKMKPGTLAMALLWAALAGAFVYIAYARLPETPVTETRGPPAQEASDSGGESGDKNEDHASTSDDDETEADEDALLEEYEKCIADNDRGAVDCCENVPEEKVRDCVKHVMKERENE